MATNEIHIDAEPDAVFAFWTDGWRYADWVVGTKDIRDVDAGWPHPGTKIHHSVGIGPIAVKDTTKVVAADEPRRLLLEARVRPFGRAGVELTVEPDSSGSLVVMREWVRGLPSWLQRLADGPITARNTQSLRRLKDAVESASAELARRLGQAGLPPDLDD